MKKNVAAIRSAGRATGLIAVSIISVFVYCPIFFSSFQSPTFHTYPLVIHWISGRLRCSSAARLESETLTTLASNWERNEPSTATERRSSITRGSSRSFSSVCSGKRLQDLLYSADPREAREDSLKAKRCSSASWPEQASSTMTNAKPRPPVP